MLTSQACHLDVGDMGLPPASKWYKDQWAKTTRGFLAEDLAGQSRSGSFQPLCHHHVVSGKLVTARNRLADNQE